MLLGVLLSTLGIITSSTPFAAWIFLVISTVCSLGFLKPFLSSSSLVLFFLVSVLGGLLFLGGSLQIPYLTIVAQVGLILKLGLVPFHFWVVTIVPQLSGFPTYIFLGFLKLGPLWLLINSSAFTVILSLPSFFVSLPLI